MNALQTVDFDNFRYILTVSLITNTGFHTNPIHIAYAPSVTTRTLDPANYIKATDTVNYPKTSCTLRGVGCAGAYVPGKFSIGSVSPWTITVNVNYLDGYLLEKACLRCTNSLQDLDFDNFEYNVYPACDRSIVLNSG